MSESARPATSAGLEDHQGYVQLVEDEIKRLDRGSRFHQWAHDITRIVVVGCGATVPVLASVSSTPPAAFAVLGSVAVVTEAVAQLFQFQPHAVNQLRTRNALERERNRFALGIRPYGGADPMTLFAERIEDIREAADQASGDAWQRSTTPAIEQRQDP